jgi:hypothetical protein
VAKRLPSLLSRHLPLLRRRPLNPRITSQHKLISRLNRLFCRTHRRTRLTFHSSHFARTRTFTAISSFRPAHDRCSGRPISSVLKPVELFVATFTRIQRKCIFVTSLHLRSVLLLLLLSARTTRRPFGNRPIRNNVTLCRRNWRLYVKALVKRRSRVQEHNCMQLMVHFGRCFGRAPFHLVLLVHLSLEPCSATLILAFRSIRARPAPRPSARHHLP